MAEIEAESDAAVAVVVWAVVVRVAVDLAVAADLGEEVVAVAYFRNLRLALLSMMLFSFAGCSNLASLKRSVAGAGTSNPPMALPQTQLANPAGQELAIAWETAQLAEQRGLDSEAIAAYRQVRAADPTRPGVAHALAVLYDRSTMTDAAAREYQTALIENPKDANLHCDHGYFLYSTGSLEQAEAALRESLRLQPEHRQATINLALVIGKQGRFDESEQLFTRAIGPAAALHNVGMLRLQSGQSTTGGEMLAEAARRDPSIGQSPRVLAWLKSHPRPDTTRAAAIATDPNSASASARY